MQEAQAQGLDTFVPFAGAKPIKIPKQDQDNWDAKIAEQDAKKNIFTDTGNLLISGINSTAEAAHELASRMPMINLGVAALDKIDEYFTGKTTQQIFDETRAKYGDAKLSSATNAARKKSWIVEPGDKLADGTVSTKYQLGDAWKDPRAYYAGIVESVPEMVVTMGGAGILAKGVFKSALVS